MARCWRQAVTAALVILAAVLAGALGDSVGPVAQPAIPFGIYDPAANDWFPWVHPSYWLYYGKPYNSPYGASFPSSWARYLAKHDGEVFYEIQSCDLTSPQVPCSGPGSIPGIIAGKYDFYLRMLAQQIHAFGKPVWLTFDHEMNGNWYPWGKGWVTPAQYVAAWRHVVRVIRPVAPNALWIWAPHAVLTGASWGGPVRDWYPGDDYCTAVGLDGYDTWLKDSFATVFQPTVNAVRQFTRKPVLIAETGIATSLPRSYLLRDLFRGVRENHLAAVIWFDQDNGTADSYKLYGSSFDYRLEDHPVLLGELERLQR